MRSAWARMACYLLAAVALVPGPYLWHGFHDIIMRGAIATAADQIVFLTLLVASMVLVRLSIGWPLVILSAIAIVYAYFGYLIPGKYGHGGYDVSRLTSTLPRSTEGFYGLPMAVAVVHLFPFTPLG